MESDVRVGRTAGVDVYVDTSWLLVLLLIIGSLTFVFSAMHPLWSGTVAFGLALVCTVLLIGTIVAREALHVVASRVLGVPRTRITFVLLGARSDGDAPTPGREAAAALVGPLTSLVIGALAAAAAMLVELGGAHTWSLTDPPSTWPAVLALVLWAIGVSNLAMAAFNLLPAFPLDGGLILRAGLWRAIGERAPATRLASRVGQAIGLWLVAIGITATFGFDLGLGAFGVALGVWLVFLGGILFTWASAQASRSLLDERLEGLTVERLMRPPMVVDADRTLAEIVQRDFVRAGENLVVVRENEHDRGVLLIEEARAIDPDEWDQRTARSAMIRLEELPRRLEAQVSALEGLRALLATDWSALPVLDPSGNVIGVLDHRDLSRWIEVDRAQLTAATA